MCEAKAPDSGTIEVSTAARLLVGISAPYEPPVAPDLILDTEAFTLDQSVTALSAFLSDRCH